MTSCQPPRSSSTTTRASGGLRGSSSSLRATSLSATQRTVRRDRRRRHASSRRRLAGRAAARYDGLRRREGARGPARTTARRPHLEPERLGPRLARPHRACEGVHLEARSDRRRARRTRQRGGMKAVRLLIWVGGGALCAGMALALGPVDQPEIVKHRAVIYFTRVVHRAHDRPARVAASSREPHRPAPDGVSLGGRPLEREVDLLEPCVSGHGRIRVGLSLRAAVRAPDPLVSDGSTCDAARPLLRDVRHTSSPCSPRCRSSFSTTRAPRQSARVRVLRLCASDHSRRVVRHQRIQARTRLDPASFRADLSRAARSQARAFESGRSTDRASAFACGVLRRRGVRCTHCVERITGHFLDGHHVVLDQYARRRLRCLCRSDSGCSWAAARDRPSPTWSSSSSELRPGACGTRWRGRSAIRRSSSRSGCPERKSYVDSQGQTLELPAPGSDRAVTVLGPAEAPVAALLHDPVLLERRGSARSSRCRGTARTRERTSASGAPRAARGAADFADAHRAGRRRRATPSRKEPPRRRATTPAQSRARAPARPRAARNQRRTARPSSLRKPKTSCGLLSTSCESSPAASTRRSSPTRASPPQCARWPSAPRFR